MSISDRKTINNHQNCPQNFTSSNRDLPGNTNLQSPQTRLQATRPNDVSKSNTKFYNQQVCSGRQNPQSHQQHKLYCLPMPQPHQIFCHQCAFAAQHPYQRPQYHSAYMSSAVYPTQIGFQQAQPFYAFQPQSQRNRTSYGRPSIADKRFEKSRRKACRLTATNGPSQLESSPITQESGNSADQQSFHQWNESDLSQSPSLICDKVPKKARISSVRESSYSKPKTRQHLKYDNSPSGVKRDASRQRQQDFMFCDLMTDNESMSNYTSPQACQQDMPDQDTVVRRGVLDVNCCYPAPGSESLEQLRVRILVRSDRKALSLDKFEQRTSVMMDEAREHNELLKELCKTDKEYELCLHTFFYRKRQISDFLGENPTWLKFVKNIQTSPN